MQKHNNTEIKLNVVTRTAPNDEYMFILIVNYSLSNSSLMLRVRRENFRV